MGSRRATKPIVMQGLNDPADAVRLNDLAVADALAGRAAAVPG
jgi:hypothetical protein